MPPEAKLTALLGATCGLKQGETFDAPVQVRKLENGLIPVCQQMTVLDYRPTPALTKKRANEVDFTPTLCGRSVKREHLATYEPLDGKSTLEPSVGGLIFLLRERMPINMNYFNQGLSALVIKRAGLSR